MEYSTIRTSMALDRITVKLLSELAKHWDVSKSEVMRRAVRRLKEDMDKEKQQLTPKEALDWLQSGGGMSPAEATAFREEVQAERQAHKPWWKE